MKKSIFLSSFLSCLFLLFSCGKDDDSDDNDAEEVEVVVQFVQSSGFDLEGDNEDIPKLRLLGSVESPTTVTVDLVNSGTTASGEDFNFDAPAIVMIPPGNYDGSNASALPITDLSIVDDTEEEETETIELRLSDPTGDAVLGDRTNTTYSILDNDGLTISFSRAVNSANESSEEDLPKILVIGTVQQETTITVTDLGNGSAINGEDYLLESPVDIVIPAGVYNGGEASLVQIPSLSIIDDDIVELTEFFELELSTATNENLGITSTRYEIKGFSPCENGVADSYPCSGYDLLGSISLSDFLAGSGNDIWGWTDEFSGKEYAIVGLNNGTAFVEISGDDPIYLGKLPTATGPSSWRDIKVYKDHAFIVSEANSHGMQVFDLTKLRNVSNPPATFQADTRYQGFGNAHNIVINEDTGFAYVVGTDRGDIYGGGAHFINIQDPKNPIAAGGYGADGYSHDAQVVTYNGPDADYLGKEIYIGSNENEVIIADVTDKDNPVNISKVSYSNISYTHQGWFTEDQQYFILGDELDEVDFGFQSRTLVFDFTDLDNPLFFDTYLGTTSAIDHNGYVKGDEYYLANYTAGLRVLDIAGIANKSINEISYFDTFPTSDNAQFSGVWSVYPYFSNGKVAISDINSGLFIVKKSN
jgi:choice-of-anchor B domain-containing protein